MQKLERGYQHIRERVKEKVRNLVPLRADSFEELVNLAEEEHAVSMQVMSMVRVVYSQYGLPDWAWSLHPTAVNISPSLYLPTTTYEARGLGRRIVMDEVHPELDGKAEGRELTIAQWRCELTAENRRELLASLLPNVNVSVNRTVDNEEERQRLLLDAEALKLTPYELKEI